MAEIMDIQEANIENTLLSPTNNDQFFDAEEGEAIKAVEETEDDDFLKKIDEAINDESSITECSEPPVKKICLETKSTDNSLAAKESLDDLDLTVEETLLKDDESSKNNIEPTIDEKSENDLLKGLDDDNQNIDDVGSEFEEILNSVQNEEMPDQKKDEKEDESKASELTKEDTNENLLELCESPPKLDEQLSNDSVSNEDGFNEEESTENKEEKEAETNVEEQKEEIDTAQIESEDGSKIQACETTETTEEVDEKIDELEKIEEKLENEQDVEKMEVDEKEEVEEAEAPAEEDESKDECKKEVEESEIKIENQSDIKIEEDAEMSTETENAEIDIKPVKTFKKENIQVKLEFMKKFSTPLGKLSRSNLEEMLIEKITEAIVFRSESAELRTKCDKQDEMIENLKQRLTSITKQYNDLDMIHKRIVKDLKDRPDQPITPVKITRAVGLQVYQPHIGNNSNNVKQKVTPAFNNKMIPANKRPNELDEKDAEAKRKKCNKIITPMRPPLSDKEKASIEKQEATIEQKIRTKVIKPDNLTTQLAIKPATNGMVIIKSSCSDSKMNSTQSIDLTDEDDMPSATANQQPPALVAIQKNNFMSSRGGLIRSNPTVRTASSPNIAIRNTNRLIAGMTGFKHPAKLPDIPNQANLPGTKKVPPRPTIKINNVPNGIIVSWTVDALSPEHAEIHSYQIYAYEETRSAPSTESWKHVGDVKALLLPMAVTLTQFQEGQKYHFAVRAVDVHRRMGQFSLPKTW